MRRWIALAVFVVTAAVAVKAAKTLWGSKGACESPCTITIAKAGNVYSFHADADRFVTRGRHIRWQIANSTDDQQIVVALFNFRRLVPGPGGHEGQIHECPGRVEEGESTEPCEGRIGPHKGQSERIGIHADKAPTGGRYKFDIAVGPDAYHLTTLNHDPYLEIERYSPVDRLLFAGALVAAVAALLWTLAEFRRWRMARPSL
jgi:hypothetical protein